MINIKYYCVFSVLIFLLWESSDAGKLRLQISNSPCNRDQFKCFNGKCIQGSWYCDNGNDCGDNSDERYCEETESCPKAYPFYKCQGHKRCIPAAWKCDRLQQCPSGDDEEQCNFYDFIFNETKVSNATDEAIEWILMQAKKETAKLDLQIHRIAVALHLSTNIFSNMSCAGKEIAYELSNQFLQILVSKTLAGVSTAELALFVNSFIVTCQNPRKFYGIDLVRELRLRVDSQNHTNPFVMLVLCNSGEKISKKDADNLLKIYRSSPREFWTDRQAYVIMALSCASSQTGSNIDIRRVKELTLAIKRQQFKNGTVLNLKTTALVMQALLSAEEADDMGNFDLNKATEAILRQQHLDGSFGDVLNTYYILPVLRFKSLIDVNADHCISSLVEGEERFINLKNQVGPKWRIQYSLWIGDSRDIERILVLRVLENTSFYGVMEIAAHVDTRYRFKYNVKDDKPYVYAVSGIQNDPETETFWNLYQMDEENLTRITGSPADFIPENNAHLVMWYQSGE